MKLFRAREFSGNSFNPVKPEELAGKLAETAVLGTEPPDKLASEIATYVNKTYRLPGLALLETHNWSRHRVCQRYMNYA